MTLTREEFLDLLDEKLDEKFDEKLKPIEDRLSRLEYRIGMVEYNTHRGNPREGQGHRIIEQDYDYVSSITPNTIRIKC